MNPTLRTEMVPPTRAARCLSATGRLLPVPPGMFRCPTLLLVLSLLAPCLQAAPAYPLVGLAVKDPRENPPGVEMTATHAEQFRMIFGGDTSSYVRNILPLANPVITPVIPYMGGYTTNMAPDGNDAQSNAYAMGIAMVKVGTLKDAITSAGDSSFTVNVSIEYGNPINPMGKIPIIPKAAVTTLQWGNSAKYDSWLRIGDELMQIQTVNYNYSTTPNTATVTVQRGHFGTTAAPSYPVGARVFTPVYLGDGTEDNPRFAQAYPRNKLDDTNPLNDDDQGIVRYAINPANAQARAFRAHVIRDYFINAYGYDGAWWDTFNQQFYNMCDAVGNQVRPFEIWNFAVGRPYTKEEFVGELKEFTTAVRSNLADKAPVTLYANTLASSYNLTGEDGTEILPNIPDDVTNLLDGACFEDSFLKPDPDDNTTYVQIVDRPDDGEASTNDDPWTDNLKKMIDAADNNRSVICMAGPAGDAAKYFHDAPSGETDYGKKLRFCYASYLMAVDEAWGGSTQDNPLSFGLPVLMHMEGDDAHVVPLHGMFSKLIGKPKFVQRNILAERRQGTTSVYKREFYNGFVAVYPWISTGPTVTIPLPSAPTSKQWYNAYTGVAVASGTVSLPLTPGDGLILVAQ